VTGFQKLCLLSCIVVFGLIILGGVVRASDSGLGCPDWPRCHGSFIPKWEKHTLIEYTHRLTASVAGVIVLAVAAGAWRSYRRVPAVLYAATLAFVLILVQAWLGKETVERELPAEVVAVHLAMALTILTLLGLVTFAASAARQPFSGIGVSRAFGRLALAASGLALALMIVGSYLAGAQYGLACNGWPLCNGDVVPGSSAASVQVHFLHRFLALLLGLLLFALAWLAWRIRRRAPFAAATAGAALAVYLVQAIVGAANIWTKLADEVTALHLGLAALLWVVLAVLNIRVHRLYELLPLAAGAPVRPDLARAPR
jgi:heme A synthase